ncbi:MAG: hypothetical protein JNK23_12370 [Opitutaceae bacterium]|nr:hypothetical protein [Opitutaceae bacterium]
MSFAPVPVKRATGPLIVVFVTSAIWLLRGYVWPTLSNVEVGPLQASLDPSLFLRDFTVQESLRFSPRFYYNQLILLPARAGLPLAWSVALWHVVALAAMIGAVHALANTLRLGVGVRATLLLWLLTINSGVLGAVFLYTHAPVPSVWAAAVAACGAALAVRQRWIAAFACFGGAALLQFLVGFYAGLLALPSLLVMARRERLPAVLAWAAGLALVYGPLWFSGRADHDALGNDAFVEIYAQLRHPHHLVPSAWPAMFWQRALLFYAGAWYFLFRTSAGRPRIERTLLNGTLALAAAALAANYIFVELVPSAFVAKLQPARITPLAQAVILGLLATRMQAALDQRGKLLAVLIGLMPLSLYPGLVLGLAAVLAAPENAKPRSSWPLLLLTVAVVVAFRPYAQTVGYYVNRFGPWVLLLVVQLAPYVLQRARGALLAGTALAMAGAAGAAILSTRPDWPDSFAHRFAIDAGPLDPPALLGRRFRDHSAKDALVLVPPTSEPWSFKLHAQRAVIVDDKNIPFTSAGLKEWHRRMETVLGRPFVRNLDAAAAWRSRSAGELLGVAAQFGAGYLLTRDEWHPELPGRRLDTEQGWSLWELPKSP